MEITRQEALELLFLEENVTEEQIKQKYKELYNEYQFSIANAQTSTLKKTYNEKLENLNIAFQQLCPDILPDDLIGSNLPIDSPFISTLPIHRKPANNPDGIPTLPPKRPSYKILLFSGLIFVIGIAIGVFSILSISQNKKEYNDTIEKADEYEKQTKALNVLIENFKEPSSKLIKNGTFRVVNLYEKPVYVMWVAGIYYDEKTNQLKSFNSGNNLGKGVKIDPSNINSPSPKPINFESHDFYWRSRVVYYSMHVFLGENGGREMYAGFWGEDVDGEKFIRITPNKID
jgi:hypothetical protein